MIPVNYRLTAAVVLLLFHPVCAPAQTERAKKMDYCVTIAVDLRGRERVSMIDLVLENAIVTSIPRFPFGWQLEIENQTDGTVVIFGAAMGSIVQLYGDDLRCLVRIQNRVFDGTTPPITAKGSVHISTGVNEWAVLLNEDQIVLEEIEFD